MNDYIINAMRTLLEKKDIDFSNHELRTQIDLNESNKFGINEVLKNTDLIYDTEKCRYELPVVAIVKKDGEDIIYTSRLLSRRISEVMNGEYNVDIKHICNFFMSPRYYDMKEKTINDDSVVVLTMAHVKGISTGMKRSKAISKALKHLDVLDDSGIKKIYNELVELISDYNKEEVKTEMWYISTNYYDLMRMSNGNSWRSCHKLEDGQYRAGANDSALDTATFMIYKESTSNTSNLITRKLIYMVENTIQWCRTYGATQGINQATKNLKEAISKNYNMISKEVLDLSCHRNDGHHYPDYDYNVNYGATFEHHLNYGKLGHDTLCLTCGDRVDDEEKLHCNYCDVPKITCYECCSVIDENDAIYVDGEYYCRDCVYQCDNCGEYHLKNDMFTIQGNFYNMHYCEDCYYDLFTTCSECGEVISVDDAECGGEYNELMCSDCMDDWKEQQESIGGGVNN